MDTIFEKVKYETELPVRCGKMDGTDSYLYHWHDAVEILCGIRGCTHVSVESVPYDLGAGDVLVIAPQLNHCVFTSDAKNYRMAVCFDAEYFFKTPERIKIFSEVLGHSDAWTEAVRSRIYGLLQELYDEMDRLNPGWQDAACEKIYKLAVILGRDVEKRSVPLHPDSVKTQSVRKALEYVSKNYEKPLTLSECAKKLGFNESYFSTLFKNSLGTTFHQYVTELKLNRAAQLLKDTGLPVGDICEKCGFKSLKTFHRVFRKKYGMAPGQYRKLQAQ